MTELEKAMIVYNRLNKVRRGPRRWRRIRKAIRTIERHGVVCLSEYDGVVVYPKVIPDNKTYGWRMLHDEPPDNFLRQVPWRGGMVKFD